MALLFAVMLTTAAGNTAMQSVMPSIGTHLRIPDVWVSLAYSWSALLWMLMAPFWARRSDRFGRKAMMALGLCAFSLSFGLCGVALLAGLKGMVSGISAILLFALARSIYGTFGSAAPPAVQAYVAARTGPDERTRALSMVASSFGLGTVLGPALAPLLILPGLGLIGPFAAFTAGALIVFALLRWRLPDDSPGNEAIGPHGPDHGFGDPGPVAHPDVAPSPRHLRWSDPRLRRWLIAGTMGGQAQSILLGVVGFLLLDRLGLRHQPDLAAGPIGLVLMCGAIATLLAQWGLIPLLGLGPRPSTMAGMALAAVGALVVALGHDLHSIATGFAVCSLGFGLFRPGFTAGASLAVGPAEQGQAAGIVAAVNGSAYIVSPAIGVWLYNHSSWMVWTVIEMLALGVLALFLAERRSVQA
ncbi:major facilitator transporter [Novosphingobium nitrogenifigens DSM 19370]|uniref:Major facilitator transporter n=1 Tax=Novosphingobium nitrogenifigens DSM 19370 TaxID=983920 RepID=F1Z5U5_9SPHN|nr:MFS transporter [Novosphingobium nitrogenifigens]EGD60205.1 major facilitator transporter [Novosphingobium nitrogenifigens DSM 19370]